jgi:hypothetical protein
MWKSLQRALVNATIGFERLAQSVEKPSKSVHRVPSPSGNPMISSLAMIFAALKNAVKVKIQSHIVHVAC